MPFVARFNVARGGSRSHVADWAVVAGELIVSYMRIEYTSVATVGLGEWLGARVKQARSGGVAA